MYVYFLLILYGNMVQSKAIFLVFSMLSENNPEYLFAINE